MTTLDDVIRMGGVGLREHWTAASITKEAGRDWDRHTRKGLRKLRLLPLGQANLWALGVMLRFLQNIEAVSTLTRLHITDLPQQLVRTALESWGAQKGQINTAFDNAHSLLIGTFEQPQERDAVHTSLAFSEFVRTTWEGFGGQVQIALLAHLLGMVRAERKLAAQYAAVLRS